MTDAPLKAASSEEGLSNSPATISTPSEARETDLGEDGSRVTPRSAHGEGDSERKYESTDPPWVPVAPRTTRRGFSEDMVVVCRKKFNEGDDMRVSEWEPTQFITHFLECAGRILHSVVYLFD